jgi:hypothetical protein
MKNFLAHAALFAALATSCAFAQPAAEELATQPADPAACHAGSSVTGTVRDATAALIPGATLQLDGVSVTSGDNGSFRFPCVSSGPHQLSISEPGFATLTLTLKTPHSAALNVTLQLDSVQTQIDVSTDQATVADSSAGGPAQTISGSRLQALADDPDDLLSELQQMSASAGGSPSNATISVDGFQSGDNNGKLPPKSSIAYIKVNPDLFSAEYRQPPFGGGHIEIYTKPGQPTFHGALFATNSSSWMNARNPFSASEGTLGKQRYGFELTGPIRKKGSDFVLDLEHRIINNEFAVNATSIDKSGNQTPLLQTVPNPQSLWIGLVKVEWQLSPKNTFIVSFDAWHNHQQNVGAGGGTLASAAYDSDAYDHNLHFTEVTTFSPKLMHEARLGIEFDGKDQTPKSFDPQVQVAGAFTAGGSTAGARHDHEIDFEFDDDAILSLSKHLLKFGLQSELLRERFRYYDNFNGTWMFGGSNSAPALDPITHTDTGKTETITGVEQYVRALNGWAGGAPTQFSNAAGNPTINLTQYRLALFVQDDWKLLPNLHFAWGLRYYTQDKAMVHNNFNPRFGLAWSPDKKATWNLHAHAGLFSGRFSAHTYAQLLDMDGTQRVTSLVYLPTCTGAFDPKGCTPLTGATPLHSIRTIQPHLSNMAYGIENLGFSHTFPHGWTFSSDYYIAQIWHDTRTENINTPLNGQPTGPRPLTPNLNILQMQSTGRGYGNVEFFGLSQQALKRFQFFFGAVRVQIVDDTDDSELSTPQISGSNAGEYSRRTGNGLWNTFGNATLQLPKKIQLSANFNGSGGAPYNVTTGFDNNGDGDFNDRPQYALPGTATCAASPSSTSCSYSTPWGQLVASGGAGYLQRNKGVMPWTYFLDTNVQRVFQLSRNAKAEHPQSVTLNVRASNVLNHTNVTSVGGVLGSPQFGQAYAAGSGRRLEAGARYTF